MSLIDIYMVDVHLDDDLVLDCNYFIVDVLWLTA